MSMQPGARLGPYEIEYLLGAGGMGEVYRALDVRLGRMVAIKVLRSDLTADAERVQRFEREARTISGLNHPHICTLHDVGQHDGTAYLVMEYLAGETLAERLTKGGLPLKRTLEYAIQIAEALDAAHQRRIVHRDLKPGNVILTSKGAKLLDFGLAKLKDPGTPSAIGGRSTAKTQSEPITDDGLIVGTLQYMAPEQIEGRPADARTDLWAFGAIVYEMLTGTRVFEAANAASLSGAILHREPTPLTTVRPLTPPHLGRIVDSCLVKDPERRRQSAHDLVLELRWIRDAAVTPPRAEPTAARTPRAWSKSVRAFIGGAVVATATLVLALLGAGYPGGRNAGEFQSVAVIPMRIDALDANTAYLCDALTQNIINGLAEVPNVLVKSWHTVLRYRGAATDIGRIAEDLDVGTVVTSEVTKLDDRLFINLELTDTRTHRVLWGHRYEISPDDLPSVQESIGDDINQSLRLTLSEEERDRLAVARLYERGRYYLEKREADDLLKAVGYFTEVVEKDPSHAPAYAGLANSHSLLAVYAPLDPSEAYAKAKASAEKALALDETLAEAHTALGLVKRDYDRDWEGAEHEFTRAIDLNPDYETAHQWYGEYLTALGRFDDALVEMKFAQKLAPSSLIINASLGWALYTARRPDEAIAQLEQTLLMNQGFPVTHWFLGWAYQAKGLYPRAIAEFEAAIRLAPTNTRLSAELAHAYGRSGRRDAAVEILEDFRRSSSAGAYVSQYWLAVVYAGLDDRGRAIDALKQACDQRPWELLFVKVNPVFDRVREHPGFSDVLQRLGLPL